MVQPMVLRNNHNKRSTPCLRRYRRSGAHSTDPSASKTRPELLCGHGSPEVQRELMERSGLIDWLTGRLHDPPPEFDPLSAVGSAAGLNSCCWGRAGATSPTPQSCVTVTSLRVASHRPVGARRPWTEGHPGWRSQPTLSADSLDCAQPGGRNRSLPVLAPGGEAGVPSDRMIEGRRRTVIRTGGRFKQPPHGSSKTKKPRWSWTWTVFRSQVNMVHPHGKT